MKFLFPLAFATLLGTLVLSRWLHHSRIGHKSLFILLFSPALGMAILSIMLFTAHGVIAPQARLLGLAMPLALMFLLLLQFPDSKKNKTSQKKVLFLEHLKLFLPTGGTLWIQNLLSLILAGLFFYTLYHFLECLMGYMSWNAFGGWDARYFWLLKARFMHRDPAQWNLLFSPLTSWANTDYPLMVPGIIAWGWNTLGLEMLIWPMVVSTVFVLSLAGMLVWYLACWRSWSTALTVGIFFLTTYAYRFWAGTFYCDIPLAFFETSAVLVWISALRLKDARLFALAGLFAGFAGWTKNEGMLFIITITSTTGLWLAVLGAKKQMPAARFFISFLCGLALPLAACLYFKAFITGRQTYLIQKSTPAEFMASFTDWKKIKFILAAFVIFKWKFENWHGLWALFGAALLYKPLAGKGCPLSSTEEGDQAAWLPALMVLLIETGYLFVFTLTPIAIQLHLQMALLRLLLHTGALALVFSFETFGLRSARKTS